ncbi:MAG: Hint domain-containing protein [Gemmobacter sp.]
MPRNGPARPDVPEEPAFVTEGLLHGTPVATPGGWRPVEGLAPGDLLLTFDGGPRAVVALQSAVVEAGPRHWPAARWPLQVPAGAMGNRWPLRLLPDQAVLLECDLADELFGDPFALIPAAALAGWRGMAPVPPRAVEAVVTPVLDCDEAIYAGGGALVWCPGEAAPGWSGLALVPPPRGEGRVGYAALSLASARQLVACLIAEDLGAALLRAAPWGGQAALRLAEP